MFARSVVRIKESKANSFLMLGAVGGKSVSRERTRTHSVSRKRPPSPAILVDISSFFFQRFRQTIKAALSRCLPPELFMSERIAIISPTYDHVIRNSLIVQVIVGILAVLMLDGGIAARVVGIAVVAYWLCAALVIARRPHEPTKLDLEILRWGFWVVLGIAALRQLYA
jgi:hypothetical protein